MHAFRAAGEQLVGLEIEGASAQTEEDRLVVERNTPAHTAHPAAVEIGRAMEELGDVGELVPRGWRGKVVAILRLEVGLVRRIRKQILAVEVHFSVPVLRNSDQLV